MTIDFQEAERHLLTGGVSAQDACLVALAALREVRALRECKRDALSQVEALQARCDEQQARMQAAAEAVSRLLVAPPTAAAT